MTKPEILVALLGEPGAVERILVRRRIDELFLVFTDEKHSLAEALIDKYATIGIQIIPIHIQSLNFSNIITTILRVVNQKQKDNHNIEFSISSGNPNLILAMCITAAIVNSSIICTSNDSSVDVSQIWPTKLVNLSYKKKQILNFLERYNGPIKQKEIAGEIGICQSGISRHINDLELAGYVTRIRIAREKVVEISDLGSAIIHQKELRKRRIWAPYTVETPGNIQSSS